MGNAARDKVFPRFVDGSLESFLRGTGKDRYDFREYILVASADVIDGYDAARNEARLRLARKALDRNCSFVADIEDASENGTVTLQAKGYVERVI